MASNLGILTANATNSTGASASAPPAWRQFTFFDAVPVKDVHDLDSPPDIFKATPEISTVISSSAGVLVADIHGSIHLLNREFESISSWIAHVAGRVTHMVERRGILVTLGEEDAVRSPLLKIWDLENKDKTTNAPNLLRSTKVQLSNRPHPVTTVALSATLAHLAIGLGDGTVLLYRHLDQSLASSTSLTSIPKARTVHESPTEPITGLGFREPTEEVPNAYLFVVTTNRVLSYQASGRGSGAASVVVDEIGSGLGCATMDWRAKDIVVARNEAIYLCGIEGRGACYAYEGHKSSIHIHLNYLVIVSPPFFPTASSASATVRNLVARSANATETDVTKVTVFDPGNKLVAYSGTFKQGVREIISQWGQIYVLSSDGKLQCLQEKSTAAKLDMLYRKSFVRLGSQHGLYPNLDESSVADIHRQYGDHLYIKGDYDGAMQQYVQTIGSLQPSYVIRKYLDAQRIHNLVTYLQELHSLGLANADHTTLLLNTYTKLKDRRRFACVGRPDTSNTRGYLAKKYERHEDYLRIQIEDAGNFSDALMYLRKLGPEAAESNLARYGRAMLQSLPEETTQLLIDLSTVVSSETATPPSPSIKTIRADTASRRGSVYDPPVSASASGPSTPPPTSSILTARGAQGLPTTPATAGQPQPLPPIPVLKKLSPRVYFPHFVDHMEQFVIFLETVAARRWGQSVDDLKPGSIGLMGSKKDEQEQELLDSDDHAMLLDKVDQVAVWNTLLELYLTLPVQPRASTLTEGGTEEKKVVFDEKTMRDKAMRVLRSNEIPYDSMHALILCSTHGFTLGLVLLWEKMGMYEDVLRFWMDKDREGTTPGASHKVIEHLMQYGEQRPNLYPLVLRFLTSSPELLRRHQEDLAGILEYIDEEGLIPPLGVIQ
ncbi:hypothetical protein B0H34DRAFT_680139, partial [Crassisporium funariophilum]